MTTFLDVRVLCLACFVASVIGFVILQASGVDAGPLDEAVLMSLTGVAASSARSAIG